jgi:hypothetical protein
VVDRLKVGVQSESLPEKPFEPIGKESKDDEGERHRGIERKEGGESIRWRSSALPVINVGKARRTLGVGEGEESCWLRKGGS